MVWAICLFVGPYKLGLTKHLWTSLLGPVSSLYVWMNPFHPFVRKQSKKKKQRGNGGGKSSLGSAVVTTGDIRDRKRKEA